MKLPRFRIRPLSVGARNIAFMFGGMLSASLAHASAPDWQLFVAVVVFAMAGGYLGGLADAQEARR